MICEKCKLEVITDEDSIVRGTVVCSDCVNRHKLCRMCGRKMKFDDSPTQGWCCDNCDYRKDVNGKEYFRGECI